MANAMKVRAQVNNWGLTGLRNLFDFPFARALALRAVAGSGAIEALASVAGAFARGALAGSTAYVALHPSFIHVYAASTRRPTLPSG